MSSSFAPDVLVSVSLPSGSFCPGAELPPELNTGNPELDQDHRQLLQSLQMLRKVCVDLVGLKDCQGCSASCQRQCEHTLIGLLGDLLIFLMDHFIREEGAMRESMLPLMEADICNAHLEDHANISAAIQQLITTTARHNTVEQLRQLDMLLQRWLKNHVMLHDVYLARWLEKYAELSLLK